VAVRNVLVRAGPEQVWAVLADGYAYAEWVVGTREVRRVDPGWPEPGTSLHFTAGLGPVRIEDRTTSRIADAGRRLELETHALPFGSLRISISIIPWGQDSVVIIDEHPLRGASLLYENPLVEVLLTLRGRRMLRRFAGLVSRRAA
jgi:hypothetical protein